MILLNYATSNSYFSEKFLLNWTDCRDSCYSIGYGESDGESWQFECFKYRLCVVFNFYFSCCLNMNANFDSLDFETHAGSSTWLTINQYSYSAECVLGSGCFASVYSGLNRTNNQKVAIKVIDRKRIKTTLQRTLVENEKQLMCLLAGKHMEEIVQYMEVIERGTDLFIVMEKGCGNLENLIKTEKLNKETVRKYALALINGLLQLQELDIVHRDLKPSNIVIDSKGNPKIVDFGFAVHQKQAYKNYSYCVGSLAYCSPQSLTLKQYSQKSDIWACGVMLYKLITGKAPWKGRNSKQIIQNIRQHRIEKLSANIEDQLMKQIIVSFCCENVSTRAGTPELELFRDLLTATRQDLNWGKQDGHDGWNGDQTVAHGYEEN